MAPQTHNSDFIGQEPVGQLLVKFATPAMISSFVNSIYNIVDRLYIGRGVGADAQAGLALTFPVMIILLAFGMMVGQGSSTIMSISLGQGKPKEAEDIVGQAVAMFLLFVVSFQILALVFLDKILYWFGGTEQAIPYAHSYLSIILWGNVFQHLSFGMSTLVRAEGSSNKAMYIILLGCVLNIILDPIFIFVFDMGIAGAAYATVISMFVSSMVTLEHFLRARGGIKLRLTAIRIYPKLFVRVVAIGMAPCLMQFVHSAIVILYNHAFKNYAVDEAHATLAIGAFGITNSVLMCMLMPAFGIMQGMQPIVGFNFGAEKFDRVRKAFRMSIHSSTFISFVIFLAVFFGARLVALAFCKEEALVDLTTYVLRLCSCGFVFIPLGMITGNYFQSLGRAVTALIISLSRQVLILVPVLIILPRIMGFNGIWWSGPVSDAACGIACFILYFFECRRLTRLTSK